VIRICYQLLDDEDSQYHIAYVTDDFDACALLPIGVDLKSIGIFQIPKMPRLPVMLGAFITHASRVDELMLNITETKNMKVLLETLSDDLPSILKQYTICLDATVCHEEEWNVLLYSIATKNSDLQTKLTIVLAITCFDDVETIVGLFHCLSTLFAFSNVEIELSEHTDTIHDEFILTGAARVLCEVAELTFDNSALLINMELPTTTFAEEMDDTPGDMLTSFFRSDTQTHEAFNVALKSLVGPSAVLDPVQRRNIALGFKSRVTSGYAAVEQNPAVVSF
jgi:hypothetical protein